MPYSGDMAIRTVVNIRARRATAAFALAVCLGVGAPASAVAQGQGQDLPDPNGNGGGGAERERAQRGGGPGQGGLPQTGLFAVPVLAAGLAFLATGVASRPARRRRRDYSCDVWWDEVTASEARQPEFRSE
jgi:hypothetical protein